MIANFLSMFQTLLDHWPIVSVVVLGVLAIFLLLPRPRPGPWPVGIGLATLALLVAGTFVVRVGALTAETFLFYTFSTMALIAGGLLVTQRNPARAALAFALVVLSTCGLFLLLAAPFLMAATVIVYAGAIIVTFLFVLMLAQQEGPSDADQRSREPLLVCLTGFLLLGALLLVLHNSYGTRDLALLLAKVQRAKGQGSIEEMAASLQDQSPFNQDFFEDFRAALRENTGPGKSHPLSDQVENAQFAWHKARQNQDVGAARRVWEQLEQIGQQASVEYSVFRPPAESPRPSPSGATVESPLSSLSGPPPSRKSLRRDTTTQQPEMPAENTAYLGRSLFTDYLLPVELGGALLLVAAIGAIAIAGRREGRNP
jgi:NADH:ubiquinone oxidoreductase subunit 6 (subunit J)